MRHVSQSPRPVTSPVTPPVTEPVGGGQGEELARQPLGYGPQAPSAVIYALSARGLLRLAQGRIDEPGRRPATSLR